MQIFVVDAFSDRPFAGNPAGVVLLDTGSFPDDGWLQDVAAEVGLAETAFAHPLQDRSGADWALRWFTPTTEVNLCGHATLATVQVLQSTRVLDQPIRFDTRSGVLRATAGVEIALDLPTSPVRDITPPPEVADAIGAELLSAFETGPTIGSMVVEVADEATVRGITPDLEKVAALPPRGGVIVTARAEDRAAGYDFVSRCFFPGIGIDEDPVTGAAHTALAPLWSARYALDELTGLQASARGGLVRTKVCGDRTFLRGSAVTVIEGRLHALPAPG